MSEGSIAAVMTSSARSPRSKPNCCSKPCVVNFSVRQFSVTVHYGAGFATQVGRSTALLTNTLGFSLDRVGLQNAGGTAFDYTNGSITVVVDNFYVPARPPVHSPAEGRPQRWP